jgi:CubicO group peptidase (beta-lactamase class C family)
MMMKRLTLIFMLLFFAAQSFSVGQAKREQGKATPLKTKANLKQTIARLEAEVPRLMNEGTIPGLSMALIQNGNLVWHHGFGVKNSKTQEPVTDNTVFEAASLSKPVFAYAILKLADAGKLDIDAPLNKYLPGNYDVGEDARLGQITARRVMSHTTGFPNWRRPGGPLTIFFTPGERFSYSGEGFVYLAKVVEQITGLAFNDFMKQTVFEPLGMKNSSYVWQSSYNDQATHRHNYVGDPTGRNNSTQANAAASLKTTAEDYGRFMVAILKGEGLKKASINQMLTPQIKLSESGTNNTTRAPEKLSPTLSWGLGWGLQTTSDGLSFWHWGDNGDSKAYIVANDKQKLGVVVFANSTNGLSILPEIVEAAIGGEQPALAWLKYESYKSPGKRLYNEVIAKGAVEALRDYRERRKTAKEALDENQMNRLGYNLMTAKRVKDAIEVFKLNVEDYPQSANVYDSLGEAYMENGDKELAIKNYQRAVELDPKNTNAIETLKKLSEKPQ